MNDKKMSNEMDKLFDDIMSEVKIEGPSSKFSNRVRERLEKYERKVRKEIVSRLVDKRAPLWHACKMGHVEMAEYLISACDADVEQEGHWPKTRDSPWLPWGEGEAMVSPLWCATVRRHTPVIDCLVRHGAEVNAISGFGMTPVHAACFWSPKNTYEAVECLVKHGADINRADTIFSRTCLMETVREIKLCEFLLKNGADVDAREIRNKTALHYAIEGKMLDTVKLLLDHGADLTLRSLENDDALQTACLVGCQPIFDYLVEHGSYSPGRLADANELMGTCRFPDTETALNYWRKAIEIRNSNAVDGKPLGKTPSTPKRDCYRNASEFTTLDELDAIALDEDALRIQNLLICERILGEHSTTFDELECRGARNAETLRYQDCLDFWKRALEISAVNDLILWSDVAEVAKGILRAIVHAHKRTPGVEDRNRVNTEQSRFADVMAILKSLTGRVVTAEPPSETRPLPHMVYGYEDILKCIIHLIGMLVKMAKTNEAEDEVRALVRRLVNRNPLTPEYHDTILHICVTSDKSLVSFYFPWEKDEQIFPDLEVTKLLLECQADVHARNENGETPLYTASCSPNFSIPIIKLLLDHGAHLDTPDICGSTPAQEISAMPDNTFDLGNYMTLRCLAAQAVVKYELQCNDLPATLNEFLDLHRPL